MNIFLDRQVVFSGGRLYLSAPLLSFKNSFFLKKHPSFCQKFFVDRAQKNKKN